MAKPQQQRQQRSKQTSILLTFCILQFVRQLRRRVKPRVLDGSIDARRLGITLSGIAGGPSPSINVQDAKQMRRVALRRRRCKSQHSHHDNPDLVRSSRHLRTPASAAPASRNLAGDKVQQMLCAVDGKLNATGNAFSSIASNSALFLKHNNASIVEGRSMGETIQLLAAVHDAVNVLFDCREQYGDDWLLVQGLDAGLELDENFIANYEHLLLRLQADLIEALSRKALEELLHGSHDKKQRKLLSWFTEFAAKPQALSTSFPWTIKPSLAVLWGVCWMYYGRCEDERARSGNRDRVPLDAVLQSIQLPWDTGASSDYVNLGRQLIGEPSQRDPHAANMGVGLEHDMFQARNTETWESDLALDGRTGRLPALMVSQAGSRADPLPLPNPDTYFDAASPYGPVVSPINNLYSPQSPGTAAPLKVFPHLGTTHHHDPWLHASPPQDTPRHLISPSITVTGASESQFFAPPQIAFASSPIYPPTGQPQAPPLNLQPPYFSYTNTPSFIMADIATSPANAPVLHEHKRTASTASIASITGDMPTPVSMGCPRSPMTSPTAGETQPAAPSPQRPHNRSLSIDSSQDGDDDGSLRKNHSYKRAEEPPRNQDGKMICKYQECNGVSFDRKCEWSKHMDKHDRPYKCNAKGCEKLQGFTYSGGLLRHEREVHKLHGGTKKSLFCPFPDCKRSSGAGFTRKENLAEHIRRVHRRTSMSADLHGLVIRRDMVRREMEGSPIPEPGESESPYSRPMEFREEDEMSLKRKRAASDSGPTDRVNDEMRTEIKRLRQENEEKDSRLKQLEQAVMALQQQGRK